LKRVGADIQKILARLPHRYPFLLVDKVLKIDKDGIVALKCVTINEPYFVGHFEDYPVMPGVLIVEAAAQAGAYFLLETIETKPDEIVYLAGVDGVRFRRPVRPGDRLILTLKVLAHKRKVFKMDAQVSCENERVMEGKLTAVLGKKG
jgi:beta-hydroxyacyl-ACP dehydratase FabZ